MKWLQSVLCVVSVVSVVTGLSITDRDAVQLTRDHIVDRVRRQTEDECAQADIVFVVDSSGSIGLENWNTMLNFIVTVIDSFPLGDLGARFGFVRYGHAVSVEYYLDQYNTKETYRVATLGIGWMDQSTNTAGGLEVMLEDVYTAAKGDRPQVPNVGIVITDGASNVNPENTPVNAAKARAAGVTMFALGIGNETNLDELKQIANEDMTDPETGETISYVFEVTDFMALSMIRQQLVQAACEIASACREDADITFILDGSSSVNQVNFDMVKSFLKDLVNELNVAEDKSHVSSITFSDEAVLNFNFLDKSDSRKSVREGLDSIVYPRGTTHTYKAIQLALDSVYGGPGDRPTVKDIIVVFTDGGSADFQKTIDVARTARLRGIYIFVVGLTDMANMYEINEMASDPDDQNVFMVYNFTALTAIKGALKNALCNDMDECATEPCLNGGVCTDQMNMYICQCPAGWAGNNCEIPCSAPKDIAVVMDASNTIQNFYMMQNFVKTLVYSLPLDKELHSKFSLMTFSSDVNVEFDLNEYRTKMEMINGISLKYTSGGSTNTGKALQALVDQVFTVSSGNREEAKDVTLVMTDGHSANRRATFEGAMAAKDMGITLLTLAAGTPSYYDMRELHGISSDPDMATMFYGMSYADMSSADNIRAITEAVCNEDDNCSPNPCNSGTCVDKIGDYECICPVGFSGHNCERGCDARLDIVFLVDDSGSIRRQRFNEIFKPLLKDLISRLSMSPDQTRVAMVTFSDFYEVQFYLNDYTRMEDALQAVELMNFRGGKTNMADTLQMTRTAMFSESNGGRSGVPRLCVIFTDGVPTMKEEMTLPEAIQSRVEGIHIITVAAEMKEDNLYLKGMASDPDKANVIAVDRFSELLPRINQIVASTCDDQDECNPSPCLNAVNCYNGLSQAICECEDDFTGRICNISCTNQLDVVFILDSSGSMEKSFDLQIQLTKEIIYGLNFAFSRTRIGLITYSNTAVVRFSLNTYTDRDSILNAVAYLREMGKTNTAAALDMASSDLFTVGFGDRNGVPNFGILMSDGHSNINEDDTVPSASSLKESGVRMMTVGVGESYDTAELDDIASSPSASNAFYIKDEVDLVSVSNAMLDQLCQ